MFATPRTSTTFETSLGSEYAAIQQGKPFSVVSLPINPGERTLLNEIQVLQSGQWYFFGNPDSSRPELEKIAQHMGCQSNPVAANFAEVVSCISSSTVKGLGKDDAWICVRSFMPSTPFVPRWHSDGRFFTPTTEEEIQVKLAFAVKGRATLFANMTPSERFSFDEAEQQLSTAYGRLVKTSDAGSKVELRHTVNQLQLTLNAQIETRQIVGGDVSGDGTLFSVGCSSAAVHSEPEFDTERIFVSIVPGTSAQIEELRKRFQRK